MPNSFPLSQGLISPYSAKNQVIAQQYNSMANSRSSNDLHHLKAPSASHTQTQQQQQYLTYLNSFYTDQEQKPAAKTQQVKNIVSMKKSNSSLMTHDQKYSVYLPTGNQQQDSRQAVTSMAQGYHTQQIATLPAYNSQSIHTYAPKLETFRVTGISQLQSNSPNTKKRGLKTQKTHPKRKSISKENLSSASSRMISRMLGDQTAQAANGSGKTASKQKSRVVKSSLKNQNTADQIVGFYQTNMSDLGTTSSPYHGHGRTESSSNRYDTQTEEILRLKMAKLQQNYQSLPSQVKSRAEGKLSLRNTIQSKLAPQQQKFDSFDTLNQHFQTNFAQSTKHAGNQLFSMTHSKIKSPQRDSFQLPINQAQDSEHLMDNSNNTSKQASKNPNKIQLKIQRIIQASNGQVTSSLQSSHSHHSLQTKGYVPNQSKLFRPQSLKQLMPTIDEQIMKLTELSTTSPSAQQNSQDNVKQQIGNIDLRIKQTPVIKIPLHPQNSSQFRGQIIRNAGQSSNAQRNVPLQFNHKESIEGGPKLQDQPKKSATTQEIPTNDQPLQQQLASILMKTQLTIKAFKKREEAYEKRLKDQQDEIESLKAQLKLAQGNL